MNEKIIAIDMAEAELEIVCRELYRMQQEFFGDSYEAFIADKRKRDVLAHSYGAIQDRLHIIGASLSDVITDLKKECEV